MCQFHFSINPFIYIAEIILLYYLFIYILLLMVVLIDRSTKSTILLPKSDQSMLARSITVAVIINVDRIKKHDY